MTKDSYFSWLLDIIEHEQQEKSYLLMLGELYDTDFEVLSTVPRDQNRAFDGLRLRDLFLDSVGYSIETSFYIFSDKKTCSILEMIIGISKRMNDELMTEIGDDKTAQYFWEICQNLGLLYYDDDKFVDNFYWNCGYDVGEICKKLCLRKYKPDGTNGGMFPMPGNTRINQKKTEIWFQMQEYINWKYGIEEFDN